MVLSWIWIIGGELIQLASEMFSSPRVVVPVCVNTIGSSKICIFVSTVTTVTAVSTVGTIIFSTPPAVTGRMPLNVTYLTSYIDVGRGATITTATTIITVLLARAILAPAIIMARPFVIAWTAVFIAVALLLALIMARTTIIITRTSVTVSHVC
jgi:hypothetical protein